MGFLAERHMLKTGPDSAQINHAKQNVESQRQEQTTDAPTSINNVYFNKVYLILLVSLAGLEDETDEDVLPYKESCNYSPSSYSNLHS